MVSERFAAVDRTDEQLTADRARIASHRLTKGKIECHATYATSGSLFTSGAASWAPREVPSIEGCYIR
jgi:hypothetical protein